MLYFASKFVTNPGWGAGERSILTASAGRIRDAPDRREPLRFDLHC